MSRAILRAEALRVSMAIADWVQTREQLPSHMVSWSLNCSATEGLPTLNLQLLVDRELYTTIQTALEPTPDDDSGD